MYINPILSIEATFVNITFQSSKQEDLNDTYRFAWVTHAKTDQIQGKFLKSEAFLTDLTNIARK